MKRRYSLQHIGGADDGKVLEVKYMTEFEANDHNATFLKLQESCRWIADDDDDKDFILS